MSAYCKLCGSSIDPPVVFMSLHTQHLAVAHAAVDHVHCKACGDYLIQRTLNDGLTPDLVQWCRAFLAWQKSLASPRILLFTMQPDAYPKDQEFHPIDPTR